MEWLQNSCSVGGLQGRRVFRNARVRNIPHSGVPDRPYDRQIPPPAGRRNPERSAAGQRSIRKGPRGTHRRTPESDRERSRGCRASPVQRRVPPWLAAIVISGLRIAGRPVPAKLIPPRMSRAWITAPVTAPADLVHGAIPVGQQHPGCGQPRHQAGSESGIGAGTPGQQSGHAAESGLIQLAPGAGRRSGPRLG